MNCRTFWSLYVESVQNLFGFKPFPLLKYPMNLALCRICFPGGSDSKMPTMWETRVQSPGQEDPLEKEMATHSSTLVWKIPRTEEPGRLQSMGLQRVGPD